MGEALDRTLWRTRVGRVYGLVARQTAKWTVHRVNTNSIEQIPSWDANRPSANRQIPCVLWKSEVHRRIHNSFPHPPILIPNNPFHAPLSHFTASRSILLSSSHLHSGRPSGLFSNVSPPKPCMYLSCSPHVPHDPPISFCLIWSTEQFLWKIQFIKLLII
jgi:hypothetical protein